MGEFDLCESKNRVKDVDPEYRPWVHDDTSTPWISLEGMGVAAINSLFRFNIPDLKWLVIDNNEIQYIPSNAFKYLPELTYISLASNKITEIEIDAFNDLNKLEVLDLDGNSFRECYLDTSILNKAPALKHLYLRNCGLMDFDLPESMDNLSRLHLSDNQLQYFYANHESALTHLHLNNNELNLVSLANFTSLVHLSLSNNWLSAIESKSSTPIGDSTRPYYRMDSYDESEGVLYLADAPALEYLIVSYNGISRIAADAFAGTGSLIHVDLAENRIEEVEVGTFNNLSRLETVLLDSNKLSRIINEVFVNLPDLKIISLKNNRIDHIAGDAWVKLNCSTNDFHLFLDNNRIQTLRSGTFRGIEGLKHVGLSDNRIKTISAQAFANLPNLGSLIIENQARDNESIRLTKGMIESNAFFNLTGLTSIVIRGNVFGDVQDQAFHTLPSLTLLDLSNNSIEHLSSVAIFDLPTVEDLRLEHNLIANIHPKTFPRQLKNLNLALNPLCQEVSCWHIDELYQLKKLNVSGIIKRFKIDDVAALPPDLTIIVG